ncbi:hypothetical protein Osc7112_3850 [Oscillatoria nigro-viridis PCC 7112]|uniref:Uncharacterized protein n=1 Tax=Phormidium nigroviride PCC 7112 TaxID=179408 RepID=K9VL20_9CYAN|nr:DUF6544 family protein [Oscillatoria nigro-viridis]AFZ08192.1 hypothetical protein Osc7112_3850 [Oscillatoria nigro-viridis PCC 7112]
MWRSPIVLIILALVVGIVGAIALGAYRWHLGTKELRANLEAARLPIKPLTFDAREIADLPQPVQRYFRAAIEDGQPLIAAARVSHEGTFNMSETAEKWSAFTSTQLVITQRPGFDWDGRIAMMPGINAFVHDAYISGEGILHAALLGLVTLADIRGTPEAALGELMRFFAEAAWYPTRLLPSQGVRWEAIDNSSARATLQDGDTPVSLDFRFDEAGLIASIRAEARARTVNGGLVFAPWIGRFWDYKLRDGMRIPLSGEVAWQLPDGSLLPYWRGRITNIAYEFAR